MLKEWKIFLEEESLQGIVQDMMDQQESGSVRPRESPSPTESDRGRKRSRRHEEKEDEQDQELPVRPEGDITSAGDPPEGRAPAETSGSAFVRSRVVVPPAGDQGQQPGPRDGGRPRCMPRVRGMDLEEKYAKTP